LVPLSAYNPFFLTCKAFTVTVTDAIMVTDTGVLKPSGFVCWLIHYLSDGKRELIQEIRITVSR
jgi:hypothetical protein